MSKAPIGYWEIISCEHGFAPAQAKIDNNKIHVQVKGSPVNRYFGLAFDLEGDEDTIAELKQLFDQTPVNSRLDSLNMSGSTRSYVPAQVNWTMDSVTVRLFLGEDFHVLTDVKAIDCKDLVKLLTQTSNGDGGFYPSNNLDIAANILLHAMKKKQEEFFGPSVNLN